MTINEMYDIIGGDYQFILGLFANSEAMVRKFCLKFLDDRSYEDLLKYVEEGNAPEAFRMAHTLKGVCQNLCLGKLKESSSEITESLRNADSTDAAKVLLPRVTADYTLTVNAIREALC